MNDSDFFDIRNIDLDNQKMSEKELVDIQVADTAPVIANESEYQGSKPQTHSDTPTETSSSEHQQQNPKD